MVSGITIYRIFQIDFTNWCYVHCLKTKTCIRLAYRYFAIFKLWIAIFVGFFAGLISLIILIKIANEKFVSKTASDVGWIVFNIYLWQSVNIMQVILCFYQVVLFIFLLHILQKISYFSNNCLCRFNHFKLYHWKSLWK